MEASHSMTSLLFYIVPKTGVASDTEYNLKSKAVHLFDNIKECV